MRRIFAIVLIVLGLSTISAAIASGTIWRPDDRVTLTLSTTPDVPLVITAPGVLNAVDNDVDVRIVGASADSPIVLAMARESDVRAWVGDAPHWEITGLVDWETLAYTDPRHEVSTDPSATDPPSGATETPSEPLSTEATETPAPTETATDEVEPTETVPNPSGSDLWVEEITGTGELEYSWTAIPGRWVMLVATDGTEPAPQIELTWDREVETPFVQPGIILGSVVLVLGLGLLIMQLLADAEKRRARRAMAAAAVTDTDTDADAVVAPAVATTDGDRPLTRRELRLADEARRRGSRSEKGEAPVEGETEAIPVVPAEGGTSPSAPTPAEADEAPADDAGELDAWVRSGSASPLLHEGDRTTPTDLEVPEGEPSSDRDVLDVQEPAAAQGAVEDQEAAPSEGGKPAREAWWRRRSARHADDAAAAAGSPAGDDSDQAEVGATEDEAGAEPSAGGVPGPSDTDEIPAVESDKDGDPQEWGASWRQTWGVGAEGVDESDPETGPKEGDR